MNTTTAITFIHEELQHEVVLVKHEGTSDTLRDILGQHFNNVDRIVTLVDVAIFFMKNSTKYEIVKNDYFVNESDFRKSEIFKAANKEIEFSSDMYFAIY